MRNGDVRRRLVDCSREAINFYLGPQAEDIELFLSETARLLAQARKDLERLEDVSMTVCLRPHNEAGPL